MGCGKLLHIDHAALIPIFLASLVLGTSCSSEISVDNSRTSGADPAPAAVQPYERYCQDADRDSWDAHWCGGFDCNDQDREANPWNSQLCDGTLYEIWTDRPFYHLGETVRITSRITNVSDAPRTFTFPTLCQMYVLRYPAECLETGLESCPSDWRYPEMCFQMESGFTLEPMESRAWVYENLPPQQQTYVYRASLLTWDAYYDDAVWRHAAFTKIDVVAAK